METTVATGASSPKSLTEDEICRVVIAARQPIEKSYRARGADVNEALTHEAGCASVKAALAALAAKNASPAVI
jgi:hypothetical protein